MKVCIDPGHGGSDPGAVAGTKPREEKDLNLAIALAVEEELEALGHRTVMTRRRDRTLSLAARPGFANRLQAEFFLSIHCNAAVDPAAEGMEVFCYPGSAAGHRAASIVLNALRDGCPGHKNRGVKEGNWAVLRLAEMPGVLVEIEFMTNGQQLAFLADPGSQQRIAAALAAGVDRI